MKNESIFSKNAMTFVKFGILGLGVGALATSIYFANKQKRQDPGRKAEKAVELVIKNPERKAEKAFIPLKVEEKQMEKAPVNIIPKRDKLVIKPITIRDNMPTEEELAKELSKVEESEMEEITVEVTTQEHKQEEIKGSYTIVTPTQESAGFDGGSDELKYFMQHYFEYPEESTRFREEGRVVLEFTVTYLGEIKDIKTIESDSPALQKEAERIIGLLPNWVPSKVNGIPVDTKVRLPIRFELK